MIAHPTRRRHQLPKVTKNIIRAETPKEFHPFVRTPLTHCRFLARRYLVAGRAGVRVERRTGVASRSVGRWSCRAVLLRGEGFPGQRIALVGSTTARSQPAGARRAVAVLHRPLCWNCGFLNWCTESSQPVISGSFRLSTGWLRKRNPTIGYARARRVGHRREKLSTDFCLLHHTRHRMGASVAVFALTGGGDPRVFECASCPAESGDLG